MGNNRSPRPRLVAVVVGLTATASLASISPAAFAVATSAPAERASAIVTATTLAITAPTSVAIGAPFTVTVRATGARHQLARRYRGTVKLTTAGHHAILPKAYTFKASDHGVHHFRVVLTRLGKITLHATARHHRKLSDETTVTVKARATRTVITCGGGGVVFGASRSCIVTVTDHSAGTKSRPAGVVKLAARHGSFGPPSSCRLPATGADRCTASYHPQVHGSIAVTARFIPASSDRTHAASVGTRAIAVCATRWTVDRATGRNSNVGSCLKPFKTLAKALAVARSGDAIRLAPGSIYPTGSSPLVVPGRVTITGQHSASEKGQPALIFGDMTLSKPNSSLAALSVEGTITSSGVNETLSDTSIFTNTPHATCVDVVAGSLTATGGDMSDCPGVGISASGTAAITLSGVLLDASTINISVGASATADLNGGNTIECATDIDLSTSAAASIDASNNIWDHAPPTTATSSPPAGVDIFNTGAGVVTTTGATVAAHGCP